MAGIDRINGSEQIVGATLNNRRVENKNSADSGGFVLPDEQEHEGVIYEPSVKKEDKPKTRAQVMEDIAREERELARQNLHSRFDGPGVEVELSTEAVKRAEVGDKQETIGDILKDFFKGIRDFFVSLWVGPDGTKAAEQTADADNDIKDEIASVMESDEVLQKSKTDDFPQAQSSGDSPLSLNNNPESIAAFMSDYGGRRLAKNSDLLTQYDRNGHIVSPNASDRRRILQGEGNIRRY